MERRIARCVQQAQRCAASRIGSSEPRSTVVMLSMCLHFLCAALEQERIAAAAAAKISQWTLHGATRVLGRGGRGRKVVSVQMAISHMRM